MAALIAGKNHYERLKVSTNATPAEIKKSFYALSKTHHPDANRSDPDASHNFSLLSESYTVLSNASRRATYDRDVLRLHEHGHHHHHHPSHHGSYHSTNPAGGRPPSGLSRRRGTFRGPPPSFYRSGGWGAHAEKRHQAHEESTGGAASSRAAGEQQQQQRANPWDTSAFHQTQSSSSSQYGGMGPGSSPFRQDDEVPPHFDREGHTRTHERQDRRRWQRQRRAVGDDGIEFEPQTSLAGHFLIVAGILAATFVAPAVYLQFMRLGRRKKEEGG
ncbi:DnaJ-domain-containing protein [Trichoderma citrinoviride]|uniref:DnaJ-domain-containing protein n=1 Tax=Trichoderma citrinoviride TaxID=58853 RepID=A0A2T4BKE8_9HYPO|nr:DnaJ-domain-containing protein [Trichoderma citrinoviride]PTB69783.1 DnaJ-domain-containing protein [Trichoderma citrinoviride]